MKKLTIKDWAEDDRPREKVLLRGITSLSNAELLAILIGSGNNDESAIQLSQRILNTVNNNLYAFNGGLGGVLDTYYLPTLITISNPYLKFNKALEIGKDCVLMLNDEMYNGMNVYISKYA